MFHFGSHLNRGEQQSILLGMIFNFTIDHLLVFSVSNIARLTVFALKTKSSSIPSTPTQVILGKIELMFGIEMSIISSNVCGVVLSMVQRRLVVFV